MRTGPLRSKLVAHLGKRTPERPRVDHTLVASGSHLRVDVVHRRAGLLHESLGLAGRVTRSREPAADVLAVEHIGNALLAAHALHGATVRGTRERVRRQSTRLHARCCGLLLSATSAPSSKTRYAASDERHALPETLAASGECASGNLTREPIARDVFDLFGAARALD